MYIAHMLDIYYMKNTKLPLLLLAVGFAAFLIAFSLYTGRAQLGLDHIVVLAMVLVIVPISAWVGVRRLRKEASGEKVEDEMTRAIRAEAASHAFGISFLLWMAVFTVSLIFQSGASVFILCGCVGMLGVYLVFHSILSTQGLSVEDTHS